MDRTHYIEIHTRTKRGRAGDTRTCTGSYEEMQRHAHRLAHVKASQYAFADVYRTADVYDVSVGGAMIATYRVKLIDEMAPEYPHKEEYAKFVTHIQRERAAQSGEK